MTRAPDPDAPRAATAGREECPPPGDAALLEELGARFAELRGHLHELWSIKVAELKLSLWEKAFAIVAAVLGLVFFATFLAVTVWFLLAGIAEGLVQATESRWLGLLLAGLIGVAFVGAALLVAKRLLVRRALKELPEKKDG
jgi:hypothetical protein